MLLLDRQAWMFSAKSFLAAILALYIALRFNLPRPYWAMTTAYIVMQPVLGGTNSRGIYRIVGTAMAAVAVVVIVPNLLHAPIVLSLALSLWLSTCLFVALLHRGPSSYVFLLAGYTAAFIGFPAVLQPDAIFDTAVARTEEIVLGSLCAVVVGAVVFPSSIGPTIRRRVANLMHDASAWGTQVLEHKGSPATLRKRLAGDLAQFDQVIPFIGRDDPRHGALDDWLLELRARMLGILPVLASIEDRLEALAAVGTDEKLDRLLLDMRDWLGSEVAPTLSEVERWQVRLAELRPIVADDRIALLHNSLLLRLNELVEIWYDSCQLRTSIDTGKAPPKLLFGLDLRNWGRAGNRHIDWGMTVFSSLAAGATMFCYCLLWIQVGWQDGASGAMLAGVAAAFFAAQDDPVPSMMKFLVWAILAILLSAVYLFGILPAIHDFTPLLIVIAPSFLLIGLMASRPSLFLPGMILITNLATLLNIQNNYTVNFSSFANSSLSTILGLMFAVVMTRLFRSVGAEWTARRLIRQGWQLLAEAAEGRGRQDRDRFLMRMLDLLGLLAPRMAALPAESDIAAVDMLDEVRIGLNILNLRRARSGLPDASRENVNHLLDRVASHYREQKRAGRALPASPELKKELEMSLSRLSALSAGDIRDEALLGLVGLRYGLFSDQRLSA